MYLLVNPILIGKGMRILICFENRQKLTLVSAYPFIYWGWRLCTISLGNGELWIRLPNFSKITLFNIKNSSITNDSAIIGGLGYFLKLVHWAICINKNKQNKWTQKSMACKQSFKGFGASFSKTIITRWICCSGYSLVYQPLMRNSEFWVVDQPFTVWGDLTDSLDVKLAIEREYCTFWQNRCHR